ncbi:Heterokaryon incompatibility protein (HET) domain containing protein [Naviculisporaceae sp. PSN 640]
MWLIDVEALELKSFPDSGCVEYAILSHTWGIDEVTFQEFTAPGEKPRSGWGWEKISRTCELAKGVGLQYVWIDTCCIDKTSSTELSEAINSMFSWYRNSTICFIHLAAIADERTALDPDIDDLANYRWFYRGWTLQELIAPTNATFIGQKWEFLGTKRTLLNRLAKVTGIDTSVLKDVGNLPSIPVARRLSWAAGRKTTRREDLAYCLLGLFNVHMPLIYGEGDKAFFRLQEAIAHSTSDLSMFAWQQKDLSTSVPLSSTYSGIFAHSPDEFRHCNQIFVPQEKLSRNVSFVLTNMGLRLDSGIFVTVNSDGASPHSSIPAASDILMGLDCFEKSERTANTFKWVAIRLRKIGGDQYVRVFSSEPVYTETRISRLNYTHQETAYIIPFLSGQEAAVMNTNTTVGIFYHEALREIAKATTLRRHQPKSSRRTPFDAIHIADRFGSYGLQSCVHLHLLTISPAGLPTHRVALVSGLCVKDDSSPLLVPWALLCTKDRFPPDHPISKLGLFSIDNSSVHHQATTELFRDYVYETCSDETGRPNPTGIHRTVVLSGHSGSSSRPSGEQHSLTVHIDQASEHSWQDLSSEYTYIIRLSYQNVADSTSPFFTPYRIRNGGGDTASE